MELSDYVLAYTKRGACTCGRCSDAPDNPKDKQPSGHTVNLTFFNVTNTGGERGEFLSLVKTEHPSWLDGKEHSYLQVGGDMGDQGIALMTIGLGGLLGAWKVLSPDTMMSFLPEDLKQKMAGSGMVSLQFEEGQP